MRCEVVDGFLNPIARNEPVEMPAHEFRFQCVWVVEVERGALLGRDV